MQARLRTTPLARELFRASVGFGLYLVLRPFWNHAGLHTLYESLLLDVAAKVFLPTQHFPVVATLAGLSVVNLDFVVVLAISLFLVSSRMHWRKRIKYFAGALALIFWVHVAAVILEIKVRTAQELLAQQQLLVLLPLEFRVVERFKYLVYDVGLQLGPFLLLTLTAIWNGYPDVARLQKSPPNPLWRRPRLVLFTAGLMLLSVVATWHRWRETHPLHVGAHARLGHIFLAQGSQDLAERQFRIAVAGHTDDLEAYYELAMLAAGRADQPGGADLLRRGLTLAPNSMAHRRFAEALAKQQASSQIDPSRRPGSSGEDRSRVTPAR